jgi:hypothetical protein
MVQRWRSSCWKINGFALRYPSRRLPLALALLWL